MYYEFQVSGRTGDRPEDSFTETLSAESARVLAFALEQRRPGFWRYPTRTVCKALGIDVQMPAQDSLL